MRRGLLLPLRLFRSGQRLNDSNIENPWIEHSLWKCCYFHKVMQACHHLQEQISEDNQYSIFGWTFGFRVEDSGLCFVLGASTDPLFPTVTVRWKGLKQIELHSSLSTCLHLRWSSIWTLFSPVSAVAGGISCCSLMKSF